MVKHECPVRFPDMDSFSRQLLGNTSYCSHRDNEASSSAVPMLISTVSGSLLKKQSKNVLEKKQIHDLFFKFLTLTLLALQREGSGPTFGLCPERWPPPSPPPAAAAAGGGGGGVTRSGRNVVCSYRKCHVTRPCSPARAHCSRWSRL